MWYQTLLKRERNIELSKLSIQSDIDCSSYDLVLVGSLSQIPVTA
jgi:hypothetical protein